MSDDAWAEPDQLERFALFAKKVDQASRILKKIEERTDGNSVPFAKFRDLLNGSLSGVELKQVQKSYMVLVVEKRKVLIDIWFKNKQAIFENLAGIRELVKRAPAQFKTLDYLCSILDEMNTYLQTDFNVIVNELKVLYDAEVKLCSANAGNYKERALAVSSLLISTKSIYRDIKAKSWKLERAVYALQGSIEAGKENELMSKILIGMGGLGILGATGPIGGSIFALLGVISTIGGIILQLNCLNYNTNP